jgi:endonuclease G, mitochondrial
MDEEKLNKSAIQAAVRHVADEYLRDPNITSVGIGYKTVDGKPTEEMALQFTVEKKVGLESLKSVTGKPIPESIEVNGMTLPTDVVERDFRTHPVAVETDLLSDRKRRLDPMVPGVSIANVHSTAGTLGCLVRENTGGETRVLSNWHVLHGDNGSLGDLIAQPGPYDNNRTTENGCGKLVRSFLGLAGDCAIASIDGRTATDEILDLVVAVRQIGDPELGDRVVKSGRTTAVTYGKVTRIHTITKITYGKAGEHQIGSFEIGPDSDHPAENGEISMPGDSGSAWMALGEDGKPSDMMLGLHFGGETVEPAEYALACYSSSVFEKLEISPLVPAVANEVVIVTPGGDGFDPKFLPDGHGLDVPEAVSAQVKNDYAPTKAGEKVRDYTHFSLAMSTDRRFCRWVAWNIDGSAIQKLSRVGVPFVLDDAYAPEFQVGEDVYADNDLDRGHIARRADLVWGSAKEADQANRDSFFFTNITPQADNFNQSGKKGLWGELENAIFADAKVDELRLSLFGGPLFKDTDLPYRGVFVPRSFWKAIAYVEDSTLKAKAYVLTQDDLEAKVESLGLEEFNLYQLTLKELSAMSGLDFGPLTGADTMKIGVEALGEPAIRRVESRAELVVG